MIARQSTALTLSIGPIMDSAGAEYTSAVIGDITITKNGTSAAMASAATLTHVSNGHYDLVCTTGNTDTVGQTSFRCNKSTYQMPVVYVNVVEEAVYDAFFAASAVGYSAAADDATITAIGALSIPTAGAIADAVCDEVLSGHVVSGSLGDTISNIILLANSIDSATDAIVADTNELQGDWANGGRLDLILDDKATPAQILTTALTESYAADGAAGTLSQVLFLIQQMLTEFAISSTTLTVKKLDGTTTAATFTLDSATTPTAINRAT